MSSDKEILTLHDNIERLLENIAQNPASVQEFWDLYGKLTVNDACMVVFEPKVAEFLRVNLSNSNNEIRGGALQLLGKYLISGLFIDEKYADVLHILVDSAFTYKPDGEESQKLWLKIVTVFLLLKIDELLKTKPREIKHVLSEVLNSNRTSGVQKAKALQMFQIYVKTVNFEAIDDIFPIWQKKIIPLMFNLQPDALVLANELLPWAQRMVQKQNEQWDVICSDIQMKYIPILLTQVYKKNTVYSTLWIFLIELLTCKLHKGLPVINSLLSVVETAFKAQDKNIRIEAFHCWQGLIDCFNFVPQEVYTKKRVKLLLIPLRTNNCKSEELVLAKFETWSRLFRVLHFKNAITTDVIDGYLYFCFGPLWDGRLICDAAPVTATHGKKYPSLHYNACLTFLQLLGDEKYFTDSIHGILSETQFVRAKMSPYLFNSSSKTVIYAVGEACLLLSQINKGECKALNECLWKSLFYMIDTNDINNNIVEDVTANVQTIISMACEKPVLIKFALQPIIKMIVSNEFKFISNENMIDTILIPFVEVLFKKNDTNLLFRCDIAMFQSIFECTRSYKNYLNFLKNIFYKNPLSLDAHHLVLEKCHTLWLHILDELKLKFNEDSTNHLELQSCFYELLKWPLSTLNARYNENIIMCWKDAYTHYVKDTVYQTKLTKSLIEYGYSLTEQNPAFIYIAELVHFLILQINLQNFTNDNFDVIYDIITYLKQIISLATLSADSATIYQQTVTHLLMNTAMLPYLPRIIAPLIDILRNIINKDSKDDLISALISFVSTVPNSPELHPHMAHILALIKPLEGDQQHGEFAVVLTTKIESKMKVHNISENLIKKPVLPKDSKFVKITSSYTFDWKKLTKRQKHRLRRRRDDIPPMCYKLERSKLGYDSDSSLEEMPVLEPQVELSKTVEASSQEFTAMDVSTKISESTGEITEPLRIDDTTESGFIPELKIDVELPSESKNIPDEITPDVAIPIDPEIQEEEHVDIPSTTTSPETSTISETEASEQNPLQKSKRKRKKPTVLADISLELDETPVKHKKKDPENAVRKRQKLDLDEKFLKMRQNLVESKKRDKGDSSEEKLKKKRPKSSSELDVPVVAEHKLEKSPDSDDKLKKKRQKLDASEDIEKTRPKVTTEEKNASNTDLQPKVRRELNRLRMHVTAEHEYKNIEQRKTRSGILLDGPPVLAPMVANPKTRQLQRQKHNSDADQQTESESIIESSQEDDHHLKHSKIPLFRIVPVKPEETSSFKTVLVANDSVKKDDELDPTPDEKIDNVEAGQSSNKPLEIRDTINNLNIEEQTANSNDSIKAIVKPEFNDSSATMSSLKIEPELSDDTYEYNPDLNTTDTQTISTNTLEELNADASTPVQDENICRQVIFDVSNEITSPESDIPSSPVENDTPSRNLELLRSTADLSPIRKLALLFPGDDEPIAKVPDISLVLFNSETSDATDTSEKASTSVSKRSSRPRGSRGALIMDMVQTGTGLNSRPMIKNEKHKVKKQKLSSPSVLHNRVSKMMEKFEKPEHLDTAPEQKEEICENDMFSFSRNLPSPTANPANGILRKRKEPDTTDENIKPVSKRKRVDFADPPVSCRKFIEKNTKQKCSPELKQLDMITNEPRVLRSTTQNSLENTDKPFQINDELTETADKIIQKYIHVESDKSQRPICPTLLNCAEPVLIRRRANLTPVKSFRKCRLPGFKFPDPKSCEVSVITSSNRDDTDSVTTDFPDDALDHSEEGAGSFNPNLGANLSPNTIRNSILGEKIVGTNVQNILLSIIRILNEKNYDPKPLLQMLFGGISNLTDILVTMGTFRIHHLATIQNWKDIISDVITKIGIWDLMRLLCQLPQVPQALMFTALLNYSVNEIGADFICEHLNKNDVLKYVLKHYELTDIIHEYDSKIIRQSITELVQNTKYHKLNFKSIINEIIDNPRDLGLALSKLSAVEIGQSIIQRFNSKVDLNNFIKQIYALVPTPSLLDDVEQSTSGADPISLTIDLIETRSISKATSLKLFHCLVQQFSANELLDLLCTALKTKI